MEGPSPHGQMKEGTQKIKPSSLPRAGETRKCGSRGHGARGKGWRGNRPEDLWSCLPGSLLPKNTAPREQKSLLAHAGITAHPNPKRKISKVRDPSAFCLLVWPGGSTAAPQKNVSSSQGDLHRTDTFCPTTFCHPSSGAESTLVLLGM